VAQSSLGLSVRPMTQADRSRFELSASEAGLVITAIDPTSDAAEKGIGVGDIILQAGGRPVRTVQELSAAAEAARRADRPLLLQVDGRNGRRFIAADVGEG
jgi:serine protease Do